MDLGERLIPSLDLVARTLATDIAYTVSRMQVLERIPGNPIGIGFRWIDAATVGLVSRFIPAFNRVVGLRIGQEQHVQPLVDWYREHGVKPTFEMVPGMFDASLGRELACCGLYHSGFHAALIGTVDSAPTLDHATNIEQVLTSETMEAYLQAYVAGWGLPEKDHAQFKSNVRPWLVQPGWSLFLARVDGQPAAAATLFMNDGVGYLADAATGPAFRGRGLQLALLRRRMQTAETAGADFVVSGAAPFTSSHRNMERAGMRVEFMRSLWLPT